MRFSHASAQVSVSFDDPNLVSCAGLVPAMVLAERAGLSDLVRAQVSVPGPAGSNPAQKVTSIVAGMLAGADSINDLDLLRHGGMDRLFTGTRAPSTLGVFLRAATFGHVRQLDAVAARLLARLAACSPLLPGADQLAYLDIDDTIRATHGYAKQGAGYGYSGVKGLNALIATLSTPLAAPVITASRLRKGATASARGAARLVADALVTANRAGASGLVVLRADSAFYNASVIAAAHRAGARFSITARHNASIRNAITSIDPDAWTPIKYADAIFDEAEQRWISEAEVAEINYTAFTSRPARDQVNARLIVRRVTRRNPASVPAGQGELFTTYRYHAVFTDSPLSMLGAESAHRAHAIIEQVIADLKNSALAHLPSGVFTANAAWLVLAVIAFNLTRALATLTGPALARASTATIRTRIITVPARIARSARRLRLHLPIHWPWKQQWAHAFTAACSPPPLPS